jgi:hypothetical protein
VVFLTHSLTSTALRVSKKFVSNPSAKKKSRASEREKQKCKKAEKGPKPMRSGEEKK